MTTIPECDRCGKAIINTRPETNRCPRCRCCIGCCACPRDEHYQEFGRSYAKTTLMVPSGYDNTSNGFLVRSYTIYHDGCMGDGDVARHVDEAINESAMTAPWHAKRYVTASDVLGHADKPAIARIFAKHRIWHVDDLPRGTFATLSGSRLYSTSER